MSLRVAFGDGSSRNWKSNPMHAALFAAVDPHVYPSTIVVLMAIGSLVLAAVWLFFPFIVSSKLTTLIEESERHTRLLEQMVQNTNRGDKPATEPAGREELGEGWKKTMSGR